MPVIEAGESQPLAGFVEVFGRECAGEQGDLVGTLDSQYYLGDINDCRVRVEDARLRVIAPPETFIKMKPGDKVYLSFREMIAFEDDGSLDEKLKIMT